MYDVRYTSMRFYVHVYVCARALDDYNYESMNIQTSCFLTSCNIATCLSVISGFMLRTRLTYHLAFDFIKGAGAYSHNLTL